jgi:hypothetical protein
MSATKPIDAAPPIAVAPALSGGRLSTLETTAPRGMTVPLRAQLGTQCQVMLHYVLSEGKELPQTFLDLLDLLDRETEEPVGLPLLVELHRVLARAVSPATPGGLALIDEDRRSHPRLHGFGPVASIRYLMVAALGFSLMFFGISLSPDINPVAVNQDIFNSSGLQLASVLVFLLSAAGLGATFGALFDAYQSISDGSYDPRFDAVYWARIGLGLISGLMLAELIPQPQGGETTLARPLLALLGGFSAAVVYRILARLVDALGSVFVPEAKRDPAADEREIRQRVAQEQALQRTALAKTFDQILDRVARGGNVDEARKGLVAVLAGREVGLGGTSRAQPTTGDTKERAGSADGAKTVQIAAAPKVVGGAVLEAEAEGRR